METPLYIRNCASRSLMDSVTFRVVSQVATMLSYVVLVRGMSEHNFGAPIVQLAIGALMFATAGCFCARSSAIFASDREILTAVTGGNMTELLRRLFFFAAAVNHGALRS